MSKLTFAFFDCQRTDLTNFFIIHLLWHLPGKATSGPSPTQSSTLGHNVSTQRVVRSFLEEHVKLRRSVPVELCDDSVETV